MYLLRKVVRQIAGYFTDFRVEIRAHYILSYSNFNMITNRLLAADFASQHLVSNYYLHILLLNS